MPLHAEVTFRVFNQPVGLIGAVGALALWFGIRLLCDFLDRSRIKDYVKQQRGTVIRILWNPFGRGWFGERGNRIYEVVYRTPKGKTVTATCKTSMFSGVYWTGGAVPSGVSASEAIQCLNCGASIPDNRERCQKCGWSYCQQEAKDGDTSTGDL